MTTYKTPEIVPAHTLALNYGVKAIVHGAPGSGKTPIFKTILNPNAPIKFSPLLLVSEPGMMSMRDSDIPSVLANTPKLLDDFFDWWFNSNEPSKYDTLGWDSVSEAAGVYLEAALKTNKHGKAAYGEMADETMKHVRRLFFQKGKHCYLICKQGVLESNGANMLIPGFPGQFLKSEVPHLFDVILHVGIKNVPGHGQVKAFQTFQTIDVMARDRSGKLAQYEPCDNLAALFAKCMS